MVRVVRERARPLAQRLGVHGEGAPLFGRKRGLVGGCLELRGRFGDRGGDPRHLVEPARPLLLEVHRLGKPLAREELERSHAFGEPRTLDGVGRRCIFDRSAGR